MKRLVALLAAAGTFVLANPARAASCSITNVSLVAFGPYSPFSGMAVQSAGSVTYVCSLFTAFDQVSINLSTGMSGSYFPRTMLSGAHPLQYNLYTDAARTKIWGDGLNGTDNYGPVILAILPVTVSIYGKIPGAQNAWQGNYEDTVTISVLF